MKYKRLAGVCLVRIIAYVTKMNIFAVTAGCLVLLTIGELMGES